MFNIVAVVHPPDKLVATVMGDAVFTCYCGGIDSIITDIQWLVNGSVPDEDLKVEVIFYSELQFGTLQFNNLTLQYNMSRINCIATFDTGVMATSSDVVLLLVQGLSTWCRSMYNFISILLSSGFLSAVGNLVVNVTDDFIASLTWTAPFSLNITAEPDVEGYCVNINRSSSLFYLQCGILETSFSYNFPPDSGCHSYMFTVIPVNVVGNGTGKTIPHHWDEPSKHTNHYLL